MRTHYHEFESLDHLLGTRLLPGGSKSPIRFVVFGGTGAVGGAVVLQLIKMILESARYRRTPLRGRIWVTGATDKEISRFAGRLYLELEQRTTIEKVVPLRHYKIGGRIEIRFDLLDLGLPRDLAAQVDAQDGEHLESALDTFFASRPQPFLDFVKGLKTTLLHAVVVAIPLPSVATYTLDRVDRLVDQHGLDHQARTRIKSRYLRRFIRGLAVIQQRHARHVVIAHTTAVGGMYRVDGGAAEIRLGFAHSALGKKLVEKKYFADELSALYLDHGFDVLVTAAAIGIDAVDFHGRLPLDRGVRGRLADAVATGSKAIPAGDLDSGLIHLYRSEILDFEPADLPSDESPAPLVFGPGKELLVEAAIRSGENGLFSVANCVALYNVMKVAIPEELAMAVVRHAVFGRERRRDWFDDKICYYGATENSRFALQLLENDPTLVRAHLGAFAVQAYQALGSSTHQARLHEIGILNLLLRLRDLATTFSKIPKKALSNAVVDLDSFFWKHTKIPAYEDLAELDIDELGRLLGALCEIETKEDAGALLDFDVRGHGLREPGREKFLARLATQIRRYLCTVTSLGIPIVWRSPVDGRDRMRVGPYVAPLELAIETDGTLRETWQRMADDAGLPVPLVRDWTIVNCGFVDLRPHALVTCATALDQDLEGQVAVLDDPDALLPWIESLGVGRYFTSCGVAATKVRLDQLFAKVRGRQIRLGTAETWKHLFPRDSEGRHLLVPGLIETVRMYSEGLGKVTGTEALWPGWGY